MKGEKTHGWFSHEHGRYGVSASELGWLGCEICAKNPHQDPSPVKKVGAIFNKHEPTSARIAIRQLNQTYICITLSILQQIKDKFSRFSRPASLSIWMAVFSLCSSANTTTETGERNCLFVGQNIFQIPFSLCQRKLSNCVRCLPCVLRINKQNMKWLEIKQIRTLISPPLDKW